MGDLSYISPKPYRIRRSRYNKNVAIMEVFGGILEFSDSVQRAILPGFTERLVNGRKLVVAGYGSLNSKEPRANATALYSLGVEVLEMRMSDEMREVFFAIAETADGGLELGVKDMGGPVWDPHTGEVFGLIHTTTNAGSRRITLAMLVAANREWIAETKQDMHQD